MSAENGVPHAPGATPTASYMINNSSGTGKHITDSDNMGSVHLSSRGSRVMSWFQQRVTCARIKRRFPITFWLPQYRFKELQSDLIAGLTVGLTVIPQGLAYAAVARLPLQYGLYSAFMGCFVYCILGTSKDITLGPTAIMSLLVGSYGVEGQPEYAVVLTLLCGVIQLVMGILNLGFVVNFLSHPVLSGFTSAAAIIIAFGQLKHIFGVPVHEENFVLSLYDTFAQIPRANYWDIIMGCICLVLLIFLKKIKDHKWNDPIDAEISIIQKICRKFIWLIGTARNAIIVMCSVLVVFALQSEHSSPFTLPEKIPKGLPPFKPPPFSIHHGNTTKDFGDILTRLGSGIAVAPLIGILESIVIAKAFAKQNKYKIDPTQELIAIGVANILGSFVSSYPTTGSFSRTAVNSQSGVRTPAGGIFTGALVLLALGVLAPSFAYIPKAALAAVIIAAVILMVDYRIVKEIWRTKKLDLVPLIATFLACLLIGIEYGIIIGVVISICILLYPQARPDILIVDKGVVVAAPDSGLNFPAAEYFRDKLGDKALDPADPRSLVVDCSHVSNIDVTVIQAIEGLVKEFRFNNKSIIFACMPTQVLEALKSAKITDFQHASSLEQAITMIVGESATLVSYEPVNKASKVEPDITYDTRL